MLTKILLGVMAALAFGLIVTGTMLKAAWQDVSELETKYDQQRSETQKVIADLNNVKLEHMRQITEAAAVARARSRDNAQLRRQTQDLRQTQDSLSAALEREPARTERVANYLFARGMRDVCRASGGSQADCKISLPKPAKAGSGDPPKAKLEEPPRPAAMHPASRLRELQGVQ